jgi:hypothetical protein
MILYGGVGVYSSESQGGVLTGHSGGGIVERCKGAQEKVFKRLSGFIRGDILQ